MAVCLYVNDFTLKFKRSEMPTPDIQLEAGHNFVISLARLNANCITPEEVNCMKILKGLFTDNQGRNKEEMAINCTFTVRGGSGIGSTKYIDVALEGSFLTKLQKSYHLLLISSLKMELYFDHSKLLIECDDETFKGTPWSFTQVLLSRSPNNGDPIAGRSYNGFFQIWFKQSQPAHQRASTRSHTGRART
ncbi:unnamed protein product [Orchesella dallaii]|uniref:Uncharacterized protein n=1 Tax=Orchesella dallaii TaxID=48710 RepID=A0ABP1QXU3_9HEXA